MVKLSKGYRDAYKSLSSRYTNVEKGYIVTGLIMGHLYHTDLTMTNISMDYYILDRLRRKLWNITREEQYRTGYPMRHVL